MTGPTRLAEHRPTDLIGTGPAELRQAFGTKAAEACELEWDCRQLDLPVAGARMLTADVTVAGLDQAGSLPQKSSGDVQCWISQSLIRQG